MLSSNFFIVNTKCRLQSLCGTFSDEKTIFATFAVSHFTPFQIQSLDMLNCKQHIFNPPGISRDTYTGSNPALKPYSFNQPRIALFSTPTTFSRSLRLYKNK